MNTFRITQYLFVFPQEKLVLCIEIYFLGNDYSKYELT